MLQTDKALRGRIFALLGSSLALGDHLVAHPQAWRLLHGKAELPSAEELKAAFTECATTTPAAEVQHALRRLYRDRLMVLAAVDVAPTVENERVLPFETIGAHLSDLADAAVAGALEVAGPLAQLTPHVPAGYGFAAIIVAFVGRLHPVGIVFSAVLMSMFYIGGELAQSRLGLPKSLTGVFQGLLLFTLLACDTLVNYRLRIKAPSLATARDAA